MSGGNKGAANTGTDVATVETGAVQSVDAKESVDAELGKTAPENPDLQDQKFLRWKRAHANDFENLPFFMIIAVVATKGSLLYQFPEESEAPTNAVLAFIVFFTICRFAHTFCTVFALQPFRSLTYVVGVLCTLAMVFIAVISWFGTLHYFSDTLKQSGNILNPVSYFGAYSFCFLVLWLLYFGTGIRSAVLKPDSEKFGEDQKGSTNIPGIGGASYQRYTRAHANAYENLPWFFIIAAVATGGGTDSAITESALAFVVLYTVFRIAHFVAFVRSMQPFRSLFYVCSVLCIMSMCVIAMAEAGKSHDQAGGFSGTSSPKTELFLATTVCFFILYIKYFASGLKSAFSKPGKR